MPDFSTDELNRSLSEIGWGLESWEVLHPPLAPPHEARAKVALLEQGDTAVISVSQSGWNVRLRSVSDMNRLPPDAAAKDEQTFDTLDHLMAYLSPAFEHRRIKLLSEKLEAISVRRDWDEGEKPQEAQEGSEDLAKEKQADKKAVELVPPP